MSWFIFLQQLVRRVFENQHKLKKLVRFCSSSLRVQEIEEVTPPSHNVPITDDIKRSATNIAYTPYLDLSPNKEQQILSQQVSFKVIDTKWFDRLFIKDAFKPNKQTLILPTLAKLSRCERHPICQGNSASCSLLIWFKRTFRWNMVCHF